MLNLVIHFTITSHGLGHLTRSLALMRALHRLLPSCTIHASTTIDSPWIREPLDFPVIWRRQGYEPGALQRNCFEVDVPSTLEAYRVYLGGFPERLEQEREFLRANRIDLVVSDISALAVRAAIEVGIPAIGVSNFTWDWILEPWCETEDDWIVTTLRESYALGTCQLRLPFGPAASSFPSSEPAPLIARRAVMPPARVREMLELGPGRLAVVCPGGWTADEWPAVQARPGDFQLVTVGDLPITADAPCLRLGHSLPRGLGMPDLIAAADVVLGKPGYGLASECLTHRVPFAMLERPGFRETPCLIAEMERSGRCSVSTLETFFSGEWETVLEGALTGGSEWREIEPDPAGSTAARVLEILHAEHTL